MQVLNNLRIEETVTESGAMQMMAFYGGNISVLSPILIGQPGEELEVSQKLAEYFLKFKKLFKNTEKDE